MSHSLGQPTPDLQMGDVVALRKPHACGGVNWEVSRVGADIGLRCLTCGRVVLLPRHEFRVKLKRVIRRGRDEP